MAALQRKRFHELPRASVIVGTVALVLLVLFAVGACHGRGNRIAREAARTTVHDIGLVPILGREELKIEPGISRKFLRHRLIQIHVDTHGLALRRHYKSGIEVVVIVSQGHFNGIVFRIRLALGGGRHQVPLLRSAGQPHGSSLHGAHAVVDDFDSGVLLVIEAAREEIAVHENVHALPLEIFLFIQGKGSSCNVIATGRQNEARSNEC